VVSDLGNIVAYYMDKTTLLYKNSDDSALMVILNVIFMINSDRPKGMVICLSDLGNILAYYLDKTTLISLLY
jgi:hypothetical protein